MAKISLCMIVRNEEETLARCLDSVLGAVDEIVIVDTGSKDSTKEIAAKYTDKVFDFVWIDDFSAARNFAFSKGGCDYLMWLDADDVITAENKKKLAELKPKLDGDDYVVYTPYDISFDENGRATFSYYRERIVSKKTRPVWIEPIHEIIVANGTVLYENIIVEHRKLKANPKGRNLGIFLKQLEKGLILSPRLRFYFARELMWADRTEEAINEFETFLSGEGWFENRLTACRDLSYCYEKLNRPDEALTCALKGFKYAPPRAELLCRVGELFFKGQKYEEAIFWYTAAFNCEKPLNSLGFIEADYYGYIPALQLCVIYDRLNQYAKAEKFNELAGRIKPLSSAYLYNKKYFQTLKKE